MTPAFKRWFGDSKVVDADGKPLRVYHWTPRNFSKFKAGGFNERLSGKAIWLAPDPGMMNAAHNLMGQVVKNGKPLPEYRERIMLPDRGHYVWEGVNVMPLYARIEYPLELHIQLLTRRRPDGRFDFSPPTAEEREQLKSSIERAKAEDAELARYSLPTQPFYLLPNELKNAIDSGFDGIIAKDLDGNVVEVIAFSPGQVKSAIGNRGTFSRRNHDVLKGAR